jgi:hypothetical protein
MYLTVQGKLGLIISDQKYEKCHPGGGGGRKSANKVSRII